MKSLVALRGEVREVPCETHLEGKPQYLLPFSVGDSIVAPDKQIFTTDTIHEPDCLRFCPSNSSENVEISLSGRYPNLNPVFSGLLDPSDKPIYLLTIF
jgi:hypothetical protein